MLMANVLVIDGSADVGDAIAAYLEGLGHRCVHHNALAGALELAEQEAGDLVMLALDLPDGRGSDIIPRLKLLESKPEIILLLTEADGEGEDVAGRYGAWDYLRKPVADKQLGLCLMRALRYREQAVEKVRAVPLEGFVIPGRSDIKRRLALELVNLARSGGPVLVTGEKGTFKARYARSLHDNSGRNGHPFVMFDCMSMPPEFARQLFIERTGQEGCGLAPNFAERVGRGTLYIKNIEAMPPEATQVMAEMFGPDNRGGAAGATCRLIVSSEKDLTGQSGNGALPDQIAAVLAANMLRVPPLRRRKEDIPDIAHAFVFDWALKNGGDVKGLSQGLLEALDAYDWPGNDVELIKTLEQAAQRAGRQHLLLVDHLPTRLGGVGDPVDNALPAYRDFRDRMLESAERAYLEDVIEQSGGSHKKAELITGLSRSRLYELLSNHGLTFKSATRKTRTK